MFTISGYALRQSKDGKGFIALQLTGDVELVQSMNTGKFYATAKRCSIPSTFQEKYAGCKVAMFLKTVFLESEARYEMFQDKEFPLKTMYQFSRRVTLYKDGLKMNKSGMIAYA